MLQGYVGVLLEFRMLFVCFLFDFFTDLIPWDENHHCSPPFGEYVCIFFQGP